MFELAVWAFPGGIVGALLMDITETLAARAGITSGVNVALVGRWFLGLLRGRFVYREIAAVGPLRHEVAAGWVFHLFVGGGGVALMYPLFFRALAHPLGERHLLAGLLFGLATSVLPWLILLPAFGWGWFGTRGPRGANALLASPLSHVPYGLGVGAVVAAGLQA